MFHNKIPRFHFFSFCLAPAGHNVNHAPMPKVSVIVVTLNEAAHLPRLKSALSALHLPPGTELETILVDGGSTDGTAGLGRSLGFSQVLELPGARIPVCRNRGLSAAGGDWIAFLDGDCEPALDWLDVAAACLGSSTPQLIGWPVSPPTPGTWVQRYWNVHWLNKHQGGTADAFRLLTTRNMLMHRAVPNALQGFDEELHTGEDTDFALRAAQHGFPVTAIPELRVIHHGEPATLRQFFLQQLWHANRKSYQKIARATGLRSGGNAVVFSALFLAGLTLSLLSILLAAWSHEPRFLWLALPLPALIALPAALMAFRAKSGRAFLPLCALYAAYGLARSVDLAGLHRTKISWKKARPMS